MDATATHHIEYKMEYVVDYNPESEICLIRVSGEIKRPDDSIRLQDLCWEYGDNHGYVNFVFDMRDATITGKSTANYDVATSPRSKGIDPDKYHVALVYSKIDPEQRVMQIVLQEHGYDVRVFDNIDQANYWLSSK